MLPDYDEEKERADYELLKTATMLLPLRERKLAKLKNALTAENKKLKNLKHDLKIGQRRLNKFRDQYKEALDDFTKHHTGVVMMHEKLFQTLENEKMARTKLLKQEEDNAGKMDAISQQLEVIGSAQTDIENCQREIEKLEYILEQKDLM
ncbi:hypothetical protein F3J37_01560 [Pantoea sp. Al-1710]|uniref:Uncharacterized protein n=1 Tax=Candidatus Pantoea communis TaxID=2608354 RepID=A0ABX0RNX4_9GAMM|nr:MULTISPECIES: hypothetical protein [Pantoea]NIG12934.1 hypothetical protein [Pantoea sp. Cy-640]NIG17365.1 hypothetical protein [Pantoea communis]